MRLLTAIVTWNLLIPSLAFADARVYNCSLTSLGQLRNAELRLYEFDRVVHSAFAQFTLEDGDTLPFVFICDDFCKMEIQDLGITYRLIFDPPLSRGSEVIIAGTNSYDDDEDFVDRFSVTRCNMTVNAGQ
jgi:hypothetical protein